MYRGTEFLASFRFLKRGRWEMAAGGRLDVFLDSVYKLDGTKECFIVLFSFIVLHFLMFRLFYIYSMEA